MTTTRLTFLLSSALLLTGCIVEPNPYYHPGPLPPPARPPVVVQQQFPANYPSAPVAPVTTAAEPSDLPPLPTQEQPEVLTRGPVHEAFAQPVDMQDQPDTIVAAQPPANLIETPPADRPADSATVWAPGYWSWDTDRAGYIWVSGCWRIAPPSKTWMPGYWTRVATGWQWVPGYWTTATAQETVYLPAPPAVADILPPGAPPTPDDAWVPSCWYWAQGRYSLRAGYWLHQRQGWLWTPSHYIRTPRGYVFAEGHWDYTLEHRGMLFAPVCFLRPASIGASFRFSPGIVVDVGVLSANLFACPRYAHYYFGDYYDDVYVRAGIYPWYECVRIGGWYDSVYVHTRWDHRAEPRWEEHERLEYTHRHDDHTLRPARTFREQEARVARLPEPQRRTQQLARPLSVVVASPGAATVRFEHLDAGARQKAAQQAEETHTRRETRSRLEAPATVSSPAVTRKPDRSIPSVPVMPPATATITPPSPHRTPAVTTPTTTTPPTTRVPSSTTPDTSTTPRPPPQPAVDNAKSENRPFPPTPGVTPANTPKSGRTQPVESEKPTSHVTTPAVIAPTTPATPSPQATVNSTPADTSRQTIRSTPPTAIAPVSQPVVETPRQHERSTTAPYVAPSREGTPTVAQPERSRQTTTTAEPTTSSRGSDRSAGNQGQPSDDNSRRDRSHDDH